MSSGSNKNTAYLATLLILILLVAMVAPTFIAEKKNTFTPMNGYGYDEPESCRWTGGGTIGENRNPRKTHGFELHCDVDDLPNNLEVNWGGDHFHLDVLTIVDCYYNASINPEHPTADCNTIHGWGDGKYNGNSGYHVEFIFTDGGEPGKDNDWAWIKVTNSIGETVMEDSGFLISGNQQAH